MKRDSPTAGRVLAVVLVAMLLGGGFTGVAAGATMDLSSPTAASPGGGLFGITGTANSPSAILEETTDTVDTTTDAVGGTLEETIAAVESVSEGTVSAAVGARTGLDGRTADPDSVDSSDDARRTETGNADRSRNNSASAGTPGATGAATDAVLVGLLGAITVSGAAAGGSGAAGTAGAASSATASWLRHVRGVGRLQRAGSALPWKVLPLFRYSRYDDSDPLDRDGRREIYERIEAAPGSYLSRVSDRTGIPLSTVRYHVRVLEDESLVTAIKVNGKRRYFLDADGAELTAALAEPAKRDVLETLVELGRARNDRLADELERDPSTISHHLSSLGDDGLVVRETDGRSIVNEVPPRVEAAVVDDAAMSVDSQTAPADDWARPALRRFARYESDRSVSKYTSAWLAQPGLNAAPHAGHR
ncbi:winged helix-turn-helix transcriptional regulator [Natrinema caseinilyticum]|uniref:winged helix-turn-helix transcriptional regulator n=1 Tax=Natrinema caseinilyticum TaxID=2961570 RepID=UPI0020C335F7|nr:helix-turn-helix domain-containing protein [Natrinema caseinilyticum]